MRSNASSIKEAPEWLADNEGVCYWTVPQGFLRPTCGGCGRTYWRLQPQRSKGGESVIGPLCGRCAKELEAL